MAFQKGDKVLSSRTTWAFGVRNGYTTKPGTVLSLKKDGIIEVKWQDGHISIHSDDELKKA